MTLALADRWEFCTQPKPEAANPLELKRTVSLSVDIRTYCKRSLSSPSFPDSLFLPRQFSCGGGYLVTSQPAEAKEGRSPLPGDPRSAFSPGKK